MSDKIIGNAEKVSAGQAIYDDSLESSTPDELKETWYRWKASSVFDPNLSPQFDLGDNVRNIVGLWYAPEETTLLINGENWDSDLSALSGSYGDVQTLRPILSLDVAMQDVPGITDLFSVIYNDTAEQRFVYIFTKTATFPKTVDEIFVPIRLKRIAIDYEHAPVVATLTPITNIIRGTNNRFVFKEVWKDKKLKEKYGTVKGIAIATGSDNYWVSAIKVSGLYDKGGSLTEREVPYNVSNTYPLAYNIISMRDNEARLSLFARRSAFMLSMDTIRSKLLPYGSAKNINDIITNKTLQNLLFFTLFFTGLSVQGFPNVKQYKTQDDKDNSISSWMYLLREQGIGKTPEQIAAFITSVHNTTEIKSKVGYTYRANFGQASWQGEWVRDPSVPEPTESEWNEFYAFLCMATSYNFSRYAFDYGFYSNNHKLILPFYLVLDTNAIDYSTAAGRNNSKTDDTADHYGMADISNAGYTVKLASRYLLSNPGDSYTVSHIDRPTITGTGNAEAIEGAAQLRNEDEDFMKLRIQGDFITKEPNDSGHTMIEVPTQEESDLGVAVFFDATWNFEYPIESYFQAVDANNGVLFDFKHEIHINSHTHDDRIFNMVPSGYLITTELRNAYAAYKRGDLLQPGGYISLRFVRARGRRYNRYSYGIYREFYVVSFDIEVSFSTSWISKTADATYTINSDTTLRSDPVYAQVGDEKVLLSTIPETIAEQTISSLASGMPDGTINSYWVWILSNGGQSFLSDTLLNGREQTSNGKEDVNTNKSFVLDLEPNDANDTSELTTVSSIISQNLFATSVEMNFTMDGSDEQIEREFPIDDYVESVEKTATGYITLKFKGGETQVATQVANRLSDYRRNYFISDGNIIYNDGATAILNNYMIGQMFIYDNSAAGLAKRFPAGTKASVAIKELGLTLPREIVNQDVITIGDRYAKDTDPTALVLGDRNNDTVGYTKVVF